MSEGGNGNGKKTGSGRPPRVVLLHGFDDRTAIIIMRAVKQVCEDSSGIAFSMTTPTNIEWKVGDLLREVLAEHTYIRSKQQDSAGQDSKQDQEKGDESEAPKGGA